jgi:putative ABC transport system permease protein
MFDLDTWQEVFSTLRKNVLRTLMTAWGVFWGTFMLVAMLGFGSGLETGVTTKMMGFAANNMWAWGGRTSMGFRGMGPGRPVRLDMDDVAALRKLPGIVAVAPSVELGGWRQGNNVTYGDKTGNFGIKGEEPDFMRVIPERPYVGRFINEHDIARRRKVTVIGEAARHMLFVDDEDPIGKYISIKNIHFQVVGVMNSEQPGEEGERNNNTLIIPLSSFQTAFNGGDRINVVGIHLAEEFDAEALEKSVKDTLTARHRANPADPQAVGSFNASKQYRRVQNLFKGISAFVWFVCVATLLAATPGSVIRLVLQEAGVLTLLAGYLGLVAGVFGLELVARIIETGSGPMGAPSIDLTAAIIATFVLAVGGTLAGIAPARHAARIQPVVALRSE